MVTEAFADVFTSALVSPIAQALPCLNAPDRRTAMFMKDNPEISSAVQEIFSQLGIMFPDANVSVELVDDDDSDYTQVAIEVETASVSAAARAELYHFASHLPEAVKPLGHRFMFTMVRA